MPTSTSEGKAWSAKVISEFPFTRKLIVDVGVGEGTYQRLLKDVVPHDTRFTGIEAFDPYVSWYRLEDKYDEIIVADAREILIFPMADVTIFGDVLEHMPRDDAIALIERAKLTSRAILASVPVVHLEQEAVNGNEYERHVYHWTFGEFDAIFDSKLALEGDIVGVYWWEAEDARPN